MLKTDNASATRYSEQGGARDAESYLLAFAAEPSVEPLLRHSGIRAA